MNVLSTALHPLDRLVAAWHRLSAKAFRSPSLCLTDGSAAATCLSDDEVRALSELSPSTLRDIGAPDWLAERRAELRARELDLMRL